MAPVRGSPVCLREPSAKDEADFLEMVSASGTLHHPWIDPPADAAGFRTFLEREHMPNMASFLVRRREDDALVGVYNISEIVRGAFQSGYLGYYADARLAGRGLMADGLRLVIRHAFGPMKLHRLEANIQPGNERSIALVRAVGFRQEGLSPRYLKIGGRWRDHERWAITVEDARRARG
jgi:ribosomal-protein-alanine N-acetyltransferase